MLETPAAAFLIPELAAEIDFFSVGTNDLAQYFLAVDRDNGKVARLYSWSHPAFLRLLKMITDEVRRAKKWIALCGEMGTNPAALPLLVALQFDEISMAAPYIPAAKQALAALRQPPCAELLAATLACATRPQVEALLTAFSPSAQAHPLLAADLLLRTPAATKEEVIKDLCDALFLAGRVAQAHLLEEALWQREETYSTGFGFGFAMPHCKSDHINANSLALARLATPVAWGSLDGQPVDTVILLALRAPDYDKEHLRIFAQLSRLVMRDEFRTRLRSETDDTALLSFLQQSLGWEK
jgi:fructose-specific PTS system IIA-like component